MKATSQKIDSDQIVKLVFILFTVILSYAGVLSLIDSLTVAHGVTAVDGQFVGRDFLYYYIANKQAFLGSVQELYRLFVIDNTYIPDADFPRAEAWPWPYPPHSFLFIYPFTILPYFYSLALWLVVSLAIHYYLLHALFKLRPLYILCFAVNINILTCLILGQNSFIISALIAIGVLHLKKNSIVSALCFSIVTIKPNYAILIPLVLMIGGYWRVLFYTGLATIFWIVLSSVILGWDVWLIYIGNAAGVSGYTLSSESWFLTIYSTYRNLLQLHIPTSIAICAHIAVVLAALYQLQKTWRSENEPLKLWLSLAITMLLLSPYSVAYDAVYVTIPCMIWFIRALFEQKNSVPMLVYAVFLLQIFAFAVISISNSLALLIIMGALSILFILNAKKYAHIP